VATLPAGLRAGNHDLQPLQPLVGEGSLEAHLRDLGRRELDPRDRLDGRELREGASLGAWRKRGAKAQAIGRSRGGQTTKIHALTDVLGRPVALELSPGNTADIRMADALLARCGPAKRLIADRGYDANALRRTLREAGTVPIIPGRRNRKKPVRHDQSRYRDRWRVEAAFCRLKDFRRIATRYDKLAANFLSAVCIAAIVAFWC